MNNLESSTINCGRNLNNSNNIDLEQDVSAPPSPFNSHMLYLTGIPTAPVIGYHPKDKSSLALFDPLLQTNRSPTKVMEEQQTTIPSIPILTEMKLDNVQQKPRFLLRALSNPKTMVMNTNFYESDYPEPPSPPPTKPKSNLMISPTRSIRKEMMTDNNRMKKTHRKKSASSSDRIISPVAFDSSNEQKDSCKHNNNNNQEKTPPLPRYRKRSTPLLKLEQRDSLRTHSQSPTKFSLRSSNWFRYNTDKNSTSEAKLRTTGSINKSDSRDDVDDDWNEDDDEQLIGLGIEEYEVDNNTALNDLSLLNFTPKNNNKSQPRNSNKTIGTVEVGLVDGVKPVLATSFLRSNDCFVQRSSEQHPSDWQLDLTNQYEFVTSTKLCQFMESYHRCLSSSFKCEVVNCDNNSIFDLKTLVGLSRADLQFMSLMRFDNAQHNNNATNNPFIDHTRPPLPSTNQRIITMLLNCGPDIISVRGYFSAGDITNYQKGLPYQREVLVLENARQFICVFRSVSTPSQKKQPSKSNRRETIELTNDAPVGSDVKSNNVTVFKDIYMDLRDLKVELFALLDKLTHENPFYDVIFCGHEYASGLATLAAYKYASSRPSLRVGAYCTHAATVKVGFHNFRLACHSLPNLKILRLEDTTSSCGTAPGCYVGHTLRIKLSTYKKSSASSVDKWDRSPIRVYKFGYSDPYLDKGEQSNHQNELTKMSPSNRGFRLSKSNLIHRTKAGASVFENETIANYVYALEFLSPQNWVKRFTNEDFGNGVRGDEDESRELA